MVMAAVVLTATAVIFLTGKAFFDIQRIQNGGDLGSPARYVVGMMFIPVVFLWAVVTMVFSLQTFMTRCKSPWVGFALGLVGFSAALSVFVLAPVRFFLPMSVFSKLVGAPWGIYIGGALQLAFGLYLLLIGRAARRQPAWNSPSDGPVAQVSEP